MNFYSFSNSSTNTIKLTEAFMGAQWYRERKQVADAQKNEEIASHGVKDKHLKNGN